MQIAHGVRFFDVCHVCYEHEDDQPCPEATSTCRYCFQLIELDEDGRWVDPEAAGDDVVWRETCAENDTFEAEHEPLG